MTTKVATVEAPTIPAFALPEAELLATLESSIYPGDKESSIKMVIGYCKAQHLDPFQKPVHIVPMSVKQGGDYVFRDVIMPGIGLYRVQAVRTGLYAGIDEAIFGPDTILKLGDKEFTHPEWCSIIVYRLVGGQRVPFSSGKVYWLETYATAKRDTKVPNAMWSKRPRGQIEKCAEAMALRRAFPELGAAPTAEELEGKVIDASDVEGRPEKPENEFMPAATSEAAATQQATTEPAQTGATPVMDVDPETGEILKPAAATPRPQAPAPDVKLASEGMIKTVRNKMARTGKTTEAMLAKFGFPIHGIPVAQINDVIAWAQAA